jgi:hypothetical protein
VSSEVSPDYREVLSGGRSALSFFMHEDLYPGVVNNLTRHAVVLEASREWVKLEHGVNLLALELGMTFDCLLAPRSAQVLELRMDICSV